MNRLTLLLIPVLITSLLTPMSSCTERHRTEMMLLDSLDLLLDEAHTALQLDVTLFDARINELNMQRTRILRDYADTMSLEFGQQMDIHRSVMKRYSRAITELKYLRSEHVSLTTQIADLRNYVRSKDYDKETFKGYYHTERDAVHDVHRRAVQLKKEVYEIEPVYMRVSDFAQEVIQGLPKD